jgi:anti-sigma B factor antagonist
MDMDLVPTMIGDIAIVKLEGRVDSRTLNPLSDWLTQSPSMVILDLSEATFLDSAALGVLVRGMKRCRQMSGDLRLCSIPAPIRMIFELTRLDKAFQIFPTNQDALQSFAS